MDDAEHHWFWGCFWEERGAYAKVAIAAFMINLFALVSPLYIMNFYNHVLPKQAFETGWVLSIGAGMFFVFDFIIKTLRSYFIDTVSRKSDIVVGQKIYRQVLDAKLGTRNGSIGSFANSLREFDALREFFNSATVTGIVDFPFSLLFIIAIWMIGGASIALLLLFLYVLVLLLTYGMQIPVRRKVHQALHTADQKYGLLVETIGALETIKGVSGEPALLARYGHLLSLAAEAGQKSRFYSGLSVHFSAFVQQFSVIIIVLMGMYLIAEQSMSIGALIAAVMLSSRAIAPIGALAALVNKYHQAKSAYRMLDKIMQAPVENPPDHTFLKRPSIAGHFQFKNLSFTYPHADMPALQQVTLQISPGEKIGIVGRIGSGKSTLVKLLLRFYDAEEGALLADNTDIRQIDPADLRRQIAYMGQDTNLMSGTIRENIALGKPDADDAAILAAAEISGAHDFIRHHPRGYDLLLPERGESLSEGQRQAIALARTLLMDTSILVLDEPTASMDAGTEDKVLRALEKKIQDKTVLFVTHKPALLRLVTRLIVMEGGKVALDGPRDQVLQALAGGKAFAKP